MRLSHVMQSIGTKYATWFNRKNERVGHLFQGVETSGMKAFLIKVCDKSRKSDKK